jgi:hypothetical protein
VDIGDSTYNMARKKCIFCAYLLAVGVLASVTLLKEKGKVHTIKEKSQARNISAAREETNYSNENKETEHYIYTHYIPAPVEDYIIQNLDSLGYDTKGGNNSAGCTIWKDPNASLIYQDLQTYLEELRKYTLELRNFKGVPDLRLHLHDNPDICKSVEVHSEGLEGIFKSGQLSWSKSGYVEPLLPPMRHPGICFPRAESLMDMGYLVHDFGAMCRQLKRHSRIVLVDMGASLAFHGGAYQPAVYLSNIFENFGFPFDHIYAYEITPQNPPIVYQLVPQKLQAAYHWINVAVNATRGARMNPLTMLLDKYNKDDLVIVKLDVDTPSVELPLANQILEDNQLAEIVDQFYFEHHVHLQELARNWKASMKGSVKDSLDLFSRLRHEGIPAHFWP